MKMSRLDWTIVTAFIAICLSLIALIGYLAERDNNLLDTIAQQHQIIVDQAEQIEQLSHIEIGDGITITIEPIEIEVGEAY